MKANKRKLDIAMARACMSANDIQVKTKMPRPSINNVLCGKSVRPDTIGKIAKALGADVTEIIDLEEI